MEFWAITDCEIQEDENTIEPESSASSYQKRGDADAPIQGDPVTDEKTPPAPTTDPTKSVTPTSIMTAGPLNLIIVRRDTTDSKPEFFISIKRIPTAPGDDPGLIPLIEVPALQRMLEEAFTPALGLRSLLPQPTPPVQQKTKKRGRK